MEQIQKIDIAVQQLEDALSAYFGGRYHSATVLAGAAEQLLAGYVLKKGLKPAWSQMRSAITKIANGLRQRSGAPERVTEDQIGSLMNHAYNNSKHAGTNDHTVCMNPKFEAAEIIDRVISNFDALSGSLDLKLPILPLAQRFVQEYAEDTTVESGATELLDPASGTP